MSGIGIMFALAVGIVLIAWHYGCLLPEYETEDQQPLKDGRP